MLSILNEALQCQRMYVSTCALYLQYAYYGNKLLLNLMLGKPNVSAKGENEKGKYF